MALTDTIITDSIIPNLIIEFKNETDVSQYFILNNYEKYPIHMLGAVPCNFKNPHFWMSWKACFPLLSKCTDQHFVYIKNFTIDVSHYDFSKISKYEEIEEELFPTNFYVFYNHLRLRNSNTNTAPQVILLEPKKSYFLVYDLSYYVLVGGNYKFVFDIQPPDKTFPKKISNYHRCKTFDIKGTIDFNN